MGLINNEVYWLSFRRAAVAVARSFNSATSNLMIGNVQLPFGANWRMGVVKKQSSKGKDYWQTTYKHVANVGQPDGPTWDDFDRCQALCRILTKSITPAKVAEVEGNGEKAAAAFWENPPEFDAPAPTGDDPPRTLEDLETIPF